MSSSQMVATAALLGNVNCDVIRRMVALIVDRTTDSNIISGLLNGIAVNAKIANKEKLIKLVGNCYNECITDITDVKVDISYQQIEIDFICKRFAKIENETKSYNTNREKSDTYTYEVEVENNCSIEINNFDFEGSVEFEMI